MFKDIRNWRPIQWLSLLVVIAIFSSIGWGIYALGFLPMMFIIAVMVGACFLAKAVES